MLHSHVSADAGASTKANESIFEFNGIGKASSSGENKGSIDEPAVDSAVNNAAHDNAENLEAKRAAAAALAVQQEREQKLQREQTIAARALAAAEALAAKQREQEAAQLAEAVRLQEELQAMAAAAQAKEQAVREEDDVQRQRGTNTEATHTKDEANIRSVPREEEQRQNGIVQEDTKLQQVASVQKQAEVDTETTQKGAILSAVPENQQTANAKKGMSATDIDTPQTVIDKAMPEQRVQEHKKAEAVRRAAVRKVEQQSKTQAVADAIEQSRQAIARVTEEGEARARTEKEAARKVEEQSAAERASATAEAAAANGGWCVLCCAINNAVDSSIVV